MKQNEEISAYYNILCNNNYPKFIDKYFNVKELKRLKTIGQFCGCEYSKLYNTKYWYSRFDHSVATALITWNFTKDKKATLAALFHDMGTPVFSHCIDFLLEDHINQESSEKSVKEILENSADIIKLLKKDNVDIKEVSDVSIYPIAENKSPKLCADRLEGVLHTVLVWLNLWQLEEIKKVYNGVSVLKNEESVDELGFKNQKVAELFFEAVYEYSMALQSNEDKYNMQYVADLLKILIKKNILSLSDLYNSSEEEIVKLLCKNIPSWELFNKAEKLTRSENENLEHYNVSVDAKKRYVIPLCETKAGIKRLDEVSKEAKKLLEKYKNFKDSKYCYIEGIKLGD